MKCQAEEICHLFCLFFRSVITISGKDGNIFDVSGVFTLLVFVLMVTATI